MGYQTFSTFRESDRFRSSFKSVCSRPYSASFPCVTYWLTCILYFVLSELLLCVSLRVGRDQPTQWENCPWQIPMGFLWHSPSEGPLSRPFTIYTHRTSYTDLMHEGPSSYFSRFLELGVATSKYLSTPIIDYRGQRYPSPSWFALCSQGSNCRGG